MKKNNLVEVYPGIFRITERGKLGLLKPPVNIYVITGSNGLVFDAGYGDRNSIKNFLKQYKAINRICRERGFENRIDRILLSHAHADHFSGLQNLRKLSGFRVILSEDMRQMIRTRESYRKSYAMIDNGSKKTPAEFIVFKIKALFHKIEYGIYGLYWGISFIENPDIIIAAESAIEINGRKWEIFSSPGHSHEHITLYNKEEGILFSGDNVLKSINVWLGPPKSDLEQYEASLTKMLNLKGLKIILPAHGGTVTRPYDRLKEIIAWRRKRTGDTLNILKTAAPEGLTVKEILEKLYPGEKRMKKEFAGGWVELTLQKLEKEKRVVRYENRYINII